MSCLYGSEGGVLVIESTAWVALEPSVGEIGCPPRDGYMSQTPSVEEDAIRQASAPELLDK